MLPSGVTDVLDFSALSVLENMWGVLTRFISY